MWQMTTLLTAALVCVAIASCAGAPNGSADVGRTLEGVIVGIDPRPDATRVVIEVEPGAPAAPGRKTVILLAGLETEIFIQRADGTVHRGRAADMVVGARVRAEITGVERRSLPPQYEAVRLRVLPLR